MSESDFILVEALEISSRIGITPEERAQPQRLTVSLRLEPRQSLKHLDDDLSRTVDYFQVCVQVKELAQARPRNLVETLADEICEMILREFAVCSVTIELRKFILPDTAWVGVTMRRPI